jgi:hypothetical protein
MDRQLSFDLEFSKYTPYAIKKTSSINGELIIDVIDYYIAKKMIVNNHYSKKWNNAFGIINIGIFKNNKLLGCAVFGNMMNTKSYLSIAQIEKNEIIELNRLWISDELGKNAETILISKAFSIIKRKMPQIKLVQSFADGRLGVGTIYKAASFNYYGFHLTKFFQDIKTNNFYHDVPFHNTKRLNSMLLKNKLYLDKRLKCYIVKTYRYIYLLDRKTKIKLKQKPYPAYEKGMIEIDYQHPIGLLCRLYLMYKKEKDLEYMNKAMLELKSRFSNEQIEKEIINQSKSNNDFGANETDEMEIL